MFKKIIIFLLAIFYINVSMGIGVQFHYCMGKMVSMAFGHDTDHNNTCGDCGMDTKESACCKDESVLLKVQDCHQPASYFQVDKYFTPALHSQFDYLFLPTPSNFRYAFSFSGNTHSSRFDKLYIAICVLRI